ncbi:hypothetical protein ACQ4PT_000978 [Festuca glaucescens]
MSSLRRSTRPRSKLKPAYADADPDAEPERGGKRRRSAAVKAGARNRKSGAAKGEPKRRRGLAEAPAMMEAGCAIDDDDMCASEPDAEETQREEEEEEAAALEAEGQAKAGTLGARRKRRVATRPRSEQRKEDASESEDHFVGDPITDDEARRRWPERYKSKDSDDPQVITKRSDAAEEEKSAQCHYRSATVEGANFDLGDDVYVRVITPKLLKVPDHEHDHKRVFLSEEKDDNIIESIISKVNITYVGPNLTQQEKAELISNCDLYYDMAYSVAYSTFANVPPENGGPTGSETSDISCDDIDSCKEKPIADLVVPPDAQMEISTLLDLYSGCGAMSTGLCLGAPLSGLKLTAKWAVDMNKYACDSLKHNHPRTQVRNEKAENFLKLLQEWDTLCKEYDVHNSTCLPRISNDDDGDENGVNEPLPEGTFEVEKLVDLCYGDPNNIEIDGLWFKQCLVACDETESKHLEKALFLRDAIDDLPKGANFRNLKGVRVGKNKSVEFDPNIPRELLSSGKPLVPNYAMTFVKGKSPNPEHSPDTEPCSDDAVDVGGQEVARRVDAAHCVLPGEAVALTEHQDSAREGSARDDAGSKACTKK